MSMIDAYKIGVELVLGGNLAAEITAMIPGLERLDASITHANAEAKGLATSLRSVAGSAPGISRAAEALERMTAAMMGVNRAVEGWRSAGGMPEFTVPSMPRAPGSPGRSASGGEVGFPIYSPNFTMPGEHEDAAFEGEGRIPLYPNGRPAPRGSQPGGRPMHQPGAFDAVLPALLTGEMLKNVFGASFDVGAKESELLTNGWSPEQVSQARALAQLVQVSTPGVTIGGGLEVLKDLGVLFRTKEGAPDVQTALTALPAYARDALVLGRQGSDGIGELFKAAQAGDLKGELSRPGTDEIDPAKFSDFIHNVVVADRVTGGRVTPGMILQNIRQGGVAASMMNDTDFFGANLALIEGMGSSAASALSGFNRQFGAGRMGKGTAVELEQLFPSLKGHWHSTGMGQVAIDNEALGKIDYLAQHPFAYVHDELLPRVDSKLRADHPDFDQWDAQKRLTYESQEGSRIATSVTGSRFLAEIMRLWPQMMREQAAFQTAQGTDLYAIEQKNNPQLKAKGLSAAWNAFEVSLGEAGQEPAIKALNGITEWLNTIAKWTKENPDGSKAALEGLAVGILAIGAAKTKDALVGLTGGGKGSLFALAGGIVALSGAMDKFPDWLQGAVKGAALGGTVLGMPGAVAGAVGGGLLSVPAPKGEFWNDPHWVEKHIFGWKYPSSTSGAPVHLESYHPEGGHAGPTIHNVINVQLDERTIARAVTRQQIRMMGGNVSGTLRPDPSIAPQYGAHLLEM